MMRTTFVCNASPLVFLAQIETLNFLDAYDIHVTSHVFDEITRGFEKHADDAAEILAYLNSRNISPVRVTFLANLPAFLGDGEKSVISFAVNKKIKHIFIDEAKARTVARLYGLLPRGVLGILWDTYQSGQIQKTDLETLSLSLIEHGYRIKESLLIEFLKRIRG